MAVVLPSESSNHYFASSPLRRSHSQPKFKTHQSPYSTRAPIKSKSNSNFGTLLHSPADSPISSTPSTSPTVAHADSSTTSYNSTPTSSLSLDSQYEAEEDQILFPSYDDEDSGGYYDQIEDLEPPASPRTGDSYTVSPTSNSTSTNISRPDSPEPVEHAEDDSAVRSLPSRHVDYLSHNWKEEDIWSSWKLIVSRRNAYGNSARLENASWRTWTKSKNKLKTVSPETLNWLKDCDVTWLYGPLQTGSDMKIESSSLHSASPPSGSRITKNNSFLNSKKPILKKRSMSEIMLQRSLSASSLLKQAAAAVQAQQLNYNGNRPSIVRATSEYITFPLSSAHRSGQMSSTLPSVSSSGLASPGSGEKKHIHFNEQVEQCIALEMKGEDEEDSYAVHDSYDSDSDDGAIMMKVSSSSRKLPKLQTRKPAPRQNFTAESKTIAMLPSTTLKYREDTPEHPETAMKHSGESYTPAELPRSSSQETLRPSKPSTRLILDDDDDEDDDVDMDWKPPNAFANRKDSVSVTHDRMIGGMQTSGSSSSLTGEPSSGMRRTPSGMFMPYEEDEDDVVSEGLFGKVVDTVNTAKDIAHVIWNVGWRR